MLLLFGATEGREGERNGSRIILVKSLHLCLIPSFLLKHAMHLVRKGEDTWDAGDLTVGQEQSHCRPRDGDENL